MKTEKGFRHPATVLVNLFRNYGIKFPFDLNLLGQCTDKPLAIWVAAIWQFRGRNLSSSLYYLNLCKELDTKNEREPIYE